MCHVPKSYLSCNRLQTKLSILRHLNSTLSRNLRNIVTSPEQHQSSGALSRAQRRQQDKLDGSSQRKTRTRYMNATYACMKVKRSGESARQAPRPHAAAKRGANGACKRSDRLRHAVDQRTLLRDNNVVDLCVCSSALHEPQEAFDAQVHTIMFRLVSETTRLMYRSMISVTRQGQSHAAPTLGRSEKAG